MAMELLSAAPIQRAIERLTQEPALLNRETLIASVQWLQARLTPTRGGRMTAHALRCAEAHLFDAPPRESFADAPDWYSFEWPGYVPDMEEANYYVRYGASELSLHALAVMRAVKREAREQNRADAHKARARIPEELKQARDALSRARRALGDARATLAKREEHLERRPDLRDWPYFEDRVTDARQKIAAHTARVSELERALQAITVKFDSKPLPERCETRSE